jgi:hypothetical protein
MRRLAWILVVILGGCLPMFAQSTTPTFEIAPTYSLLRITQTSTNFNGGSVSAAVSLNRSIQLAADFGGYTGGGGATLVSYLFGSRFLYRGDRLTPFAQALFGGVSETAGLGTYSGSTSIGLALGGGLDVGVSKSMAIRVVQADYFMTRFVGQTQNNVRLSFGIVFRLKK